MTLKKAVTKVTEELSKDKGFFIGYTANIAMAFIDAFNEFYQDQPISNKTKNQIHEIANIGAKKFLQTWIAVGKEEETLCLKKKK